MMRFARSAWLLALLAALMFVDAVRAADELPPIKEDAKQEMVAMRDNVKLATNVFLPEGNGPFPVILSRTPYCKDAKGEGHRLFVKNGYAVVVQDCRGKFRSEGEYRPFLTDREDGFDTVNWIASQKWCSGKIGMTGGSALGITQLYAAIANPENLVCAFVIVAPQSFWNESTFINGVFKQADVGTWMEKNGAGAQLAERRATIEKTDEELSRDIIHHRHQIDIPIYHVGGWYDIFSTGTQGNFTFLQNEGAAGAHGNQKLLMGPWGHGKLTGDLAYDGGEMSAIGEIQLRWFDYHLKGIDNGIMEEPPVRYYQMAAARTGELSNKNGWQTAANWPMPANKQKFYLTGERELTAKAPTGSSSATTYAFDPANPVPTFGGANLTLPLGPQDQRQIGKREDYLRFQSAPLESDVKISGPVKIDLFASTDAPDTDFMVKLVDVYPDGYEAIILDAPFRARYRNGRKADQIKMMKPGQPEKLSIFLGSTANTFEKGHRLAVHVTSSNSPRFEVNPNTGEPLGQSTLPPRVATNSIHHDAEHPSAIVLPVVE